eukprot:3692879-Rhodomonas_salina.4
MARPIDDVVEAARAKRVIRRQKIDEMDVVKVDDYLLRRLEALEDANLKMNKAVKVSELHGDKVLSLERKLKEQEVMIKEQQRQISRLQHAREQSAQEVESLRTAVQASLARNANLRGVRGVSGLPKVTVSTTDFRALQVGTASPNVKKVQHEPSPSRRLSMVQTSPVPQGVLTVTEERTLSAQKEDPEYDLALTNFNVQWARRTAQGYHSYDDLDVDMNRDASFKFSRIESTASSRSFRDLNASSMHQSRKFDKFRPMAAVFGGGGKKSNQSHFYGAGKMLGGEDDGNMQVAVTEEEEEEEFREKLEAKGFRLLKGSDNAFGVFIFVCSQCPEPPSQTITAC